MTQVYSWYIRDEKGVKEVELLCSMNVACPLTDKNAVSQL